jgi:formylglycine-generating enzyme required for sulfatase activity
MINKYIIVILIILISGCQAANQAKGNGDASSSTSNRQIPWQSGSMKDIFCFSRCGVSKELAERDAKIASLEARLRVVIPAAGSFRMGDIQGGGYSDEQPVHRVSVGKFAMGEWEYTSRAGTSTKYWWGNDIDESKANYSWNLTKTSPVGNYAANKFCLYDTVGNLWEWICSEYTKKYNGNEKQCVTNASRFVQRGGSWYDVSGFVRSASRDRNTPTVRNMIYGFRLARLLTL